jgi:hypothetical protein
MGAFCKQVAVANLLQCEIIQGRELGKLLAPVLLRLTFRVEFGEQQLQPAPCFLPSFDNCCGACALRSLVAYASRRSAGIIARKGAVKNARAASRPHCGHSRGKSHSAIGRKSVNAPQSSHS